MKAMYPGSFDPITIGHLDIIERASKSFDELVVAILKNPSKKYAFTENERKQMIEKCVAHLPNVKVVVDYGLTVDCASKLGCQVIVRGIRAIADYEYELAQATGNMTLNPDIETMLLVAKPEYSFLSSSIAKEVAYFGGDITTFIPAPILDFVQDRLKNTH